MPEVITRFDIQIGQSGARTRGVLCGLYCTLALLIGVGAVRAEAEEAITLAERGEAYAVIVVPEDAPPPVVFAGEELKSHLDRMLGDAFEIVETIPDDRPAIVLGDTSDARAAGIRADEMERDAYVIRTVGQHVYIAGRDDDTGQSEILYEFEDGLVDIDASRNARVAAVAMSRWDFGRGTLNGAYRLLEELGVRWFLPGPRGTVIPSRDHIALPALDLQEAPHFKLGTVGNQAGTSWLADPSMRSEDEWREMSDIGWTDGSNRLWLLRVRQPSRWMAFNHHPTRTDWIERFGESNPEYFALGADGSRALPPASGHTGYLNYTNEDVFRETIADIDAFFAGEHANTRGISVNRNIRTNVEANNGWNPNVAYDNTFSLLPQDGSNWNDHTRESQQYIKHDAPRWERHTNLIWQFVDRVARDIQDRWPEVKITTLAYSTYTEVPDREVVDRMPDNVIVGICPQTLNKMDRLLDPASYQRYADLVDRWRERTDQPFLVWQHLLYRHRQASRTGLPMLIPSHLGRTFREVWAPNARWIYLQIDKEKVLEHINRYVAHRLMWEPELDVDALIRDYADSFFGPGAEPMHQLVTDIEQRSERLAAEQAGMVTAWEEIFSEEVMSEYRRLIDDAHEQTQETPHADAVALFDEHFLGHMERAREQYVGHVADARDEGRANMAIRRLRGGTIAIDGELDPAWEASSTRTGFYSNRTGERIVGSRWKDYRTSLRLLENDENVYFFFECYDPETADHADENGGDNVEIFLDPQHDHHSYYQVMINMAGDIVHEAWHEGRGEDPDATWESGAEVAVQHHEDRWTVEVKMPRASLSDGLASPAPRPWGANFGRTMQHPPDEMVKYTCFSPHLRGGFHQPDLFGQIYFQNSPHQ